MNHIKAMKTALEALEQLTWAVSHPDNVKTGKDGQAALRTAIEQAEKQEPVAQEKHGCHGGEDSTLPAPVQDEVTTRLVSALQNILECDEEETIPDDLADEARKAIESAFATPPAAQRQWVGLDGFEQKKLMAMSAREAVFATEAMLREKNGSKA